MTTRFNTLLREYRLRAGLTQEELAERSGVSARTIGRLEADEGRGPRVASVRNLVKALPLTSQERNELLSSVYTEAEQGQAAPESAPPVQRWFLPHRVPDFTGRQPELQGLVEAFQPSATDTVAILHIDGMAGVGKSTLAIQAAHAMADQYPDGQFFCDLHGFTPDREPLPPDAALESLLRMAGVPGERIPQTTDSRAAAWRAAIAGRRVLILLDNAKDASQVRPLLPGTPGCLVVVTSRRRLPALPVVFALSLGVLPRDEAAALFTTVAGHGRVCDDSADVDEIVDLCGCLPLAVRIAAARLAHRPAWSPRHLVERMKDDQRRLIELGGDQEHGVAVAFTTSYQQLNETQRRIFRLLGLNPGVDIALDAVTALADVPLIECEAILETLVDHNLLLQPVPGRYALHNLLHHHARSLADTNESAAERHSALTRLFDHYLHTAAAAMDIIVPHERHLRPRLQSTQASGSLLNDSDAANTWLATELTNIVACAARATVSDWQTHTIHLSTTLWRWLDDRACYTNAQTLHEHALEAARAIQDRAGEADALRFLGTVHWRWGHYNQAARYHQEATDIARELGDRTREACALNNLGTVYERLGQVSQAAEYFSQALEIFHDTGLRGSEGYVLNSIGNAHLWSGEYEQATEYHNLALKLFREVGDHTSEARTLHNLGNVLQRWGHHDEAVHHHQQALELFRTLGTHGNEGYILNSIGSAHQSSGRHDLATAHYTEAFALAKRTGERHLETQALIGLSVVARESGDALKALEHSKAALTIALETGDRNSQASAQECLGLAFTALDKPGDAHDHLLQALTIYTELGMPEARSLRQRLANTGYGDPS